MPESPLGWAVLHAGMKSRPIMRTAAMDLKEKRSLFLDVAFIIVGKLLPEKVGWWMGVP